MPRILLGCHGSVWILFLLKAVENDKKKFFFLSGLFFGSAFLMKQPGIFFFAFGFFYFSWIYFNKNRNLKSGLALRLTIYTLGSILPFAITCLYLYFAGVFEKFWFWTFQYAIEYSSNKTLAEILQQLENQFAHVAAPFRSLWYISALGFACVFVDVRARKNAVFAIALLIVSFLSVCLGFRFREHYFVTLLPVISLLAGCCINSISGYIWERKKSFDFIYRTHVNVFRFSNAKYV